MNSAAFTNIKDFLTPKGYIVVMPDTESSLTPAPDHGEFGADLAFLVGQMQTEGTTASSSFFNAVSTKAAIIGHSMGGGATFLAAANNTSIQTIVTFAPAETSPSAIAAAASVTVPTLVLAGEDECVLGQMGTSVTEPFDMYDATAANCKFYTELVAGTHCNFTNGDASFPFLSPAFNCFFGETAGGCPSGNLATQHAQMEALVEPWLAYWLQEDCAAFATFETTLANTSDYINTAQVCNIIPLDVTVSSSTTSICVGDMATLTAAPTGGNPAYMYDWLPTTGLSAANIANPTASPTATTTYSVTVADANNCTATEQVTIAIDANCASVLVRLQVFLQGAFNGIDMNTDLLDNGLLGLAHPYDVAPWNVAAGSATSIPTDAVDWILIEARDANDNTLVLETQPAFVLNNGEVVDLDGNVGLSFTSLTAGNDYYLAVRHRNHLDVIAANAIALPNATVYDFSSPANVLGGTTQVADLDGGTIYGLYTGDMNGNGVITVEDYNYYISEQAGQTVNQYGNSDCNLDGNLTVSDFNVYRPNASVIGVSQVRF